MSAIHYPVRPMDPSGVVCVSGAGDCFAAAFISSALRAATQDEAVAAGIQVLKGGSLIFGLECWKFLLQSLVRLSFITKMRML